MWSWLSMFAYPVITRQRTYRLSNFYICKFKLHSQHQVSKPQRTLPNLSRTCFARSIAITGYFLCLRSEATVPTWNLSNFFYFSNVGLRVRRQFVECPTVLDVGQPSCKGDVFNFHFIKNFHRCCVKCKPG